METQKNSSEQLTQSRNFRIRLQQELIGRCRKNPSYSLRAFAKSLGVAPSALSDMLNNKRTITPRAIEKLGLSLGLSLAEIDEFKSNISSSTRSRSTTHFKLLTQDVFALISDWYHYAILELMKVESFNPDNSWIAKALGISKSEANAAIERLVRLNLLEIGEDGSWRDTSDGFTTSLEEGLTSVAAKNLQREILSQAIAAIAEVPLGLRDNTSITMAIDPADLPLARKKIKDFRRELCESLEKTNSPRDVYQLAISLFPITTLN